MPRPATGQILERKSKDGRVLRTLRFRAGGKRHTVPLGVVSRAEAERELGFVMADVARGVWRPPPRADVPVESAIPTFHEFAETWWTLHEREWRSKTVADYRWKLECHLLPTFGHRRLDELGVADVEQYAASKLAEDRPLSARSINATITLLAQILEAASDRDLLGRNPARGRGRKIRERPPIRTYLETAGQIAALLNAAHELDEEAREDRKHVQRRAILATLTFAGLRIGELCSLRWSDFDLSAGWLTVGEAKNTRRTAPRQDPRRPATPAVGDARRPSRLGWVRVRDAHRPSSLPRKHSLPRPLGVCRASQREPRQRSAATAPAETDPPLPTPHLREHPLRPRRRSRSRHG